jgi:hypothetical protein
MTEAPARRWGHRKEKGGGLLRPDLFDELEPVLAREPRTAYAGTYAGI